MTEEPKLSIQMAQRIELWPLDRLKPYERNARTHSAEQVAQIAASIVELIQAPMQYHAPKLIGHGSFGPLSFGRLQTSGGGGGYQP